MNKYFLISLIFVLFTLSCSNNNNKEYDAVSNNDSKDIFSNRDIIFKNLELNNEEDNLVKNTNEYSVTNVGVRFSPPINCIRLSDKEKEDIISQTGYGKDYFYTDSMFIDENIKSNFFNAYTVSPILIWNGTNLWTNIQHSYYCHHSF